MSFITIKIINIYYHYFFNEIGLVFILLYIYSPDVTLNLTAMSKTSSSVSEKSNYLQTLKARFEQHKERHKGIQWDDVQTKLEANPKKIAVLAEMEATEGEPDVVDYDKETGEYIFFDCSQESPKGRRSICYDRKALESRKAHKPKNSAMDLAAEIGIEILTEAQYQQLQKLGQFDLKTSSWLYTPERIRNLGGAIFGDRRFDTVFIYHNGADSYYGARGFRGCLRV